MKSFNTLINDKIMPAMGKMSQNTVIKAIQYGAMATMPLTLGVSLIAILVNLPFQAWTAWLAATGIDVHMRATIKVTMEITALYMTFMIGYHNSQERGTNGITGGIVSLGALLVLMPHTIKLADGTLIAGLDFGYLGSNGIFGGMLVGVIVSGFYSLLDKKGLVIKLPSSVPPMVAQSLSPTFISMIIFTLLLFVRIGFGATHWGNYFDFINQVLGTPIMALGANPTAAIVFMVVVSLFWFFGIHPNTVLSAFMPVLITTGQVNLSAYMAGQPMPYLAFTGAMAFYGMGGAGNTLGISLLIPFISKSERYKTLGKLSIGPAVFNINEPIIFGLPIMLNPIFFVPMVGSSIVNGVLGVVAYNLGVFNTLNPSVSLPWIMPAFVAPIFRIGVIGTLAAIAVIAIDALIYLPFFRKADQLALAEEQEGIL